MNVNKTEFENISKFLEGLRFKKTLFGANMTDVYSCMQELDTMYCKVIKEQKAQFEAQYVKQLKQIKEQQRNALAERDTQVDQLTEKIQELKQLSAENVRKMQERFSGTTDAEQKYQEQMSLLTQTMTDIQKDKLATIEKAQREARSIIAQAKLEADKLVENAKREIAAERQSTDIMLNQIAKTRRIAIERIQLIHGDLVDLTESIENLKENVDQLPEQAEQTENSARPSFIEGVIGDVKHTDCIQKVAR